MKIKLTERSVTRLKPPARGRLDVWDATLPAFGIQLRATGQRSWLIAVRRPGKATTSRIKIGNPTTMSLADARVCARDLMNDPSSLELKATNPDVGRLAANSPIDTVIASFILRDQKPRNRSWKCAEQILRYDLKPWYRLPLDSITKADVLEVLDRVLDRGRPRAANLLLAHVKRMFNWTVERGLLDASPAAGVKPPSPKSERDRVLTDAELRAVWHGAIQLGWPFGPLVRLLVLTGQREGEVAGMRWADLDAGQALWALASGQTKAARAHLVPLSEPAIQIIRELPRVGELVFPARGNAARPVSGFSKAKLRLDRFCGVQDWVFHDLRRTAATALAQLEVPPHVVEKIINHRGAGVAGPMGKIYQRYDYLKERRAALELWAQHVLRVSSTASRYVT
jgi:integrase